MRTAGLVVLMLGPPRPTARRSGTGGYVRMGQLRIEGDKLLPSYHSGAPETTLARLREALRAQVCAPDFIPVGSAAGESISC